MNYFDVTSHKDFWLHLNNDGKLYSLMKEAIFDWVQKHHNESVFDSELKQIIRYAHVVYSRNFHFSGYFEVPVCSESFVDEFVEPIKSMLIQRLYREMGLMNQIYEARLSDLIRKKDILAYHYNRTNNPHLAIVLRQLPDSRVCHIANLEFGGFGNGIYGNKALDAFIERCSSSMS